MSLSNFKISLLFLLLSCISYQIRAQDPDIFDQTWYLYEIYDSDFGDHFYIEGYQPYGGSPAIPQITPYVIIDQSLNFNGLGICNTFEGVLEYDIILNAFRTESVNQTNETCGFYEDMHEPYIIGPFGYVDPDPEFYTIIGPTITNDSDGFQTLRFDTQPFIQYTYRNTPILGIQDFESANFTIFPNPSDNLLNVKGTTDEMISIILYDTTGKHVHQVYPAAVEFVLDISSLNSGLYLLQIRTANSIEYHRIVKK